MESRYPSWKGCATCDNWNGPRNASAFRDQVEYRSDADSGLCVDGGWHGTRTPANKTYCHKWLKWKILK